MSRRTGGTPLPSRAEVSSTCGCLGDSKLTRVEAAHTGTTPYPARADALLGAARMIAHSNLVGVEMSALVSTGILTLEPGSTNTIPSKVVFKLDIRAPEDATVDAVETRLKRDFAALAHGGTIDAQSAPRSLPLAINSSWYICSAGSHRTQIIIPFLRPQWVHHSQFMHLKAAVDEDVAMC